MIINGQNIGSRFNQIGISKYWSTGSERELKMHRIHNYPAKFPSLIVTKSLEYAMRDEHPINRMGDIFCGCGTTALEAKINNINFWGCDINPVATLIAEVKSTQYDKERIEGHYNRILASYHNGNTYNSSKYRNNERIKYWFSASKISELEKLLFAIRTRVRDERYKKFFLCAFSNILKPTSMWLTKSIKPQLDKSKEPKDVLTAFEDQVKLMAKANDEYVSKYQAQSNTHVETMNFLEFGQDLPFLDMVVTSPPYVTSYEYADLHQLSTLWLGFVEDYRSLRKGTIGSLHDDERHRISFNQLNAFGKRICEKLRKVDGGKAKSVAKYFLDIERAVTKTYSILNDNGYAVFVIGNTKYKSVNVNNARYLTQCMIDCGFEHIDVSKRKITGKILTPYRDEKGKFSKNQSHREVYANEYVVIGRK